MPFLEAVVLEALRLYSPAYMVGRCACRPAQLAGYSLPAGTTVLVSPYLLQRDARLWRDEQQFRPQRWLELFEEQQARQQGAAQRAAQQQQAGGGTAPVPGAANAGQQQEQQRQAAVATLDPSPQPHAAPQQQQQRQQQGPPAGGMGMWPALLKDMGPNGAYIPFGSGPRNCIGTGFAMMETLLVVSAVLQRLELRPAPGAGFPRPAPILTLRPERVELQLVPRAGAAGGGAAQL
jgi:cytochrome P450